MNATNAAGRLGQVDELGGGQSIRRAISILRMIAEGREAGVRQAELVTATGLSRPTVHRIVRVLMEEGVVEKNERTHRLAVGEQVSQLALARSERSPFLLAAQPHLEKMSRELGDTLFLTVRTRLDTLCIARKIGDFPIQVLSLEIGARRPLGVSSAGVALLAALPGAEADAIIARNSPRFRGYRTTQAEAVDQVARARARGIAVRDIGLVPGTKSISVVIRALDPRPAAAITLSAVQSRLTARREEEVADVLRAGAKAIEGAAGHASDEDVRHSQSRRAP